MRPHFLYGMFNPLKRVALQLLLLIGIYFISRCLFTLINLKHFEHLTLEKFLYIAFQGIRFDISALLIINSLYIIFMLLPLPLWRMNRWRRALNTLFVLLNCIALVFEICDIAYFPFNLKRSTADVMDMVTTKGDFWSLLARFFVDYWFVPFIWLGIVFLFIKVNNVIIRSTAVVKPAAAGIGHFSLRSLVFVVVGGFCIIGIRGGLQYIPIGMNNAIEVAESRYTPIVLDTPFSILQTYFNDRLTEPHYMPQDMLIHYIDPEKYYGGRSFKKNNVVVIILESFSKEYTGLSGHTSYTPFLDSLMKRGLVCKRAYANALHSADGVPAIIYGLPSLMEEPITRTVYANDRMTALPSLLKKKGYSSAFYHGGTNGTMSFDVLCASAGYDRYYGRTEYHNEKDYDGNWGIWDEPYLQYFANGLNQMKQPFFASVFTLSSHPPFNIPEKYKSVFPATDLPIKRCIAYSDMALRKFFETASKSIWYKNTLFVLSADHCSPMKGSDYTQDNMGQYDIPILYYAPGDSSIKGAFEDITQQIDILPSVMDYLGYDQPFFAFGNSIFRKAEKRYTVNYLSGTFQLVQDGYLLKTKEKQADGLFAFPSDSTCKNNLLQQKQEVVNKEMVPSFDAILQTYRSGIINDALWIRPKNQSPAGNQAGLYKMHSR
jgi:glucan phosphoethanolaminetransferase (alkaline phosphatase superfamily)